MLHTLPEVTLALACTAQHSTAQHIRQACTQFAIGAVVRHRLECSGELCQCSCEAHPAQHPTQHRTAHTVGLVQIQLVDACITEPFPSGNTSYPVALLVHGHITVCAITQQDLVPASNKPFSALTKVGTAKFTSLYVRHVIIGT